MGDEKQNPARQAGPTGLRTLEFTVFRSHSQPEPVVTLSLNRDTQPRSRRRKG